MGRAKKHPKKVGPQGQLPIFEFDPVLKEGVVAGPQGQLPIFEFDLLYPAVKSFGTAVKKASKKVVETSICVWCS
jgi:hypothetical protein